MQTPIDALKFKHPTTAKIITPFVVSSNQYVESKDGQQTLSKERFVAPFFAIKKTSDSAQANMKVVTREVECFGKYLKVPVIPRSSWLVRSLPSIAARPL